VSKEEHVLSWEDAAAQGPETAGGKGWNLGRLARYGFKVTPGIVLSTSAYRVFIEQNSLQGRMDGLSARITLDNLMQYEAQLKVLREAIQASSVPQFIVEQLENRLREINILDQSLAARSSASAEDSEQFSFAGIHESFLNVKGLPELQEAIKGCYASLWTSPAVAYRRRFALNDSAVMPAIVVMQMVEARASGIAFSCDPQTGRPDRIVINANYGLGDSVVSGAIEPDCYYLDSSAWYAAPPLTECRTGSKKGSTRFSPNGGTTFVSNEDLTDNKVLNTDEVSRLGRLVLRIYESLGAGENHVDIEWAYDGKEFYVLQSRPVTALPVYTFEGLKGKQEFWSNGNYREACPMVLCPLQRRVMKNSVDIIQYTSLSQLSYPIPEGFQFARYFNGRMYCNMSALQWSYWDCSGMLPENFTPMWGGHQPAVEIEPGDPYQGEVGQARQQRAMKGFVLTEQAAREAPDIFAGVIESAEAIAGRVSADTPDFEFISIFEDTGTMVSNYSNKFNFLAGVGSIPMVMLMQQLYPYLGGQNMFVINGLMVGGDSGITSADQGYRLLELAEIAREDPEVSGILKGEGFDPLGWQEQLPDGSRFKEAFANYLRDFGHRAVYELEIMNPRWQEDPTYLFDMIRSTMVDASISKYRAKQAETAEKAWQQLKSLVPEAELESIRSRVLRAQQGAAVREMTKSVIVVALNVYRKMAQELGHRFKERNLLADENDIFYCSWSDIIDILAGNWDGRGLAIMAADRKLLQQEQEKLPAPDLIMGKEPVFCLPQLDAAGNYLQGVGAAAGRSSGPARLIIHPSEGNRLNPGDVLVAPSTDPAWTPLFLKAAALVMETGGFLCHGSIVAREYGVPAVVNVAGVMHQIEDGQPITVDGDVGRIYLS